MTGTRFLTMAMLALGLTVCASAGTVAQTGQPPAAAANVTQDELKSYAVAAVEVQQINQSYQPAIQGAQSADEQRQLHDQAMEKMAKAVVETGLSLDKYNQITKAMQSDPELAKQVQGYIQAQ